MPRLETEADKDLSMHADNAKLQARNGNVLQTFLNGAKNTQKNIK